MKKTWHIKGLLATVILLLTAPPISAEKSSVSPGKELNVKEFILEHLADSYEWHIVDFGKKDITVPLPIILHSKTSGWHRFSSTRFHHGETAYKGFYISTKGKYKGKIVEADVSGNETRPLDLSLTKNAASLLLASLLLILIIMGVPVAKAPPRNRKSFTESEMFIMSIHENNKTSVGDITNEMHLLLTVFFLFYQNLLD